MRIPERCKICGGRSLVYASIRGAVFRVRYARCESCDATTKTIAAIPQKTCLYSNDIEHHGQTIGNNASVDSFTHSLER